jgi:hypothetical protein
MRLISNQKIHDNSIKSVLCAVHNITNGGRFRSMVMCDIYARVRVGVNIRTRGIVWHRVKSNVIGKY